MFSFYSDIILFMLNYVIIPFNILRITVYTTTMSAAIPGEYNTLVRPQVMKYI